ncbi:unnamed protein product [Polarella glacialis]|uniref:EF-hand domain-containing protein n=1 Tax=Polarella glacialis TaxID=89957 RepID=A0A813IY45_POLGL|nr:unnamed protein product [Polarella glacialis]
MGASTSVADSPLISFLHGEFERAKSENTKVPTRSHGKNGLYFHQIQQLQPPRDFPLDLRHIGTLWKLDSNHDGFVSFEELLAFAEFCNDLQRTDGDLDLAQKLKANCVMEMWESISEERSQDAFADWIICLVTQGEPHKTFAISSEALPKAEYDSERGQPVRFLHHDAVMTLYELMTPYQIATHIDQQSFLDLLQQIAEVMSLQPLTEQELDDWVPVEVVHSWVKRFIAAQANLFKELGLNT